MSVLNCSHYRRALMDCYPAVITVQSRRGAGITRFNSFMRLLITFRQSQLITHQIDISSTGRWYDQVAIDGLSEHYHNFP